MIPIGAIVVGIRAAMAVGGGRAVARRTQIPAVLSVKLFLAATGIPIVAVAAYSFVDALTSSHEVGAFACVAATTLSLLVLFVPSVVLRQTTVRLGWHRATYYLARALGAFSLSQHFRSGAALLAAEALTRARQPSPAAREFVERKAKLGGKSGTNAATWLILASVEAAASEHPEERRAGRTRAAAMAMLGTYMHWKHAAFAAHRVVASSALADAMTRGDFVAVRKIPWRALGRRGRALRVLGLRIAGLPIRLQKVRSAYAAWVLGRSAHERLALLDEPSAQSPSAENVPDDALRAATTRAHIAFLAEPRPTTSSLRNVLNLWDRLVVSSHVAAHWERRALGLGARRAALCDVKEQAVAALAHHALAADLFLENLGEGSASADALRLAVKNERWSRLDEVSQRLLAQVDTAEPDPLRTAWSDVAQALLLWSSIVPVSSPAEVHRSFSYALDRFACWICDRRSPTDKVLAYAIFHFLHESAAVIGDVTNADRLRRNMGVCAT